MQPRIIIVFLILAMTLIAARFVMQSGNEQRVLIADASQTDQAATEHDLYNPTRAALVNAQRQLALTYSSEMDMIEQKRRISQELDNSLKLLAEARHSDVSMQADIDALRAKISDLRNAPRDTDLDGESLRDLYSRLLTDFEKLINHY